MVKKIVVQERLSLFRATLVGSLLLEPKRHRRKAVKTKWSTQNTVWYATSLMVARCFLEELGARILITSGDLLSGVEQPSVGCVFLGIWAPQTGSVVLVESQKKAHPFFDNLQVDDCFPGSSRLGSESGTLARSKKRNGGTLQKLVPSLKKRGSPTCRNGPPFLSELPHLKMSFPTGRLILFRGPRLRAKNSPATGSDAVQMLFQTRSTLKQKLMFPPLIETGWIVYCTAGVRPAFVSGFP